MTVHDFYSLTEMLNSSRVKFKMSTDTHKHVIGIGGSIEPSSLLTSNLPTMFTGIRIDHDNSMDLKQIEFIPTTGESFKIKIE